MDRRSLLKLFGLGAVATALPAMPAAAKVEPLPPVPLAQRALANCFRDPLYADVYTEGTHGERYRHRHPVKVGVVDQGGVNLSFDANFTGTIKTVTIGRGEMELCYLPASDFISPHVVEGNAVQIAISIR